MLYQPYTIFFEIDDRLYIKFEALYWFALFPNVRNVLFSRLIYRVIPLP